MAMLFFQLYLVIHEKSFSNVNASRKKVDVNWKNSQSTIAEIILRYRPKIVARARVCIHERMSVYVYASVYMCVCVCVRVYVYVCLLVVYLYIV